jgi:hypothetical protein
MRRLAAVLALVLLASAMVSCGSDDDRAAVDERIDAALPFGLQIVEGTETIGRPAVREQEVVAYEGKPVTGRTLQAAFRVTSDHPLKVLRAWVAQLDHLALDDVSVRAGSGEPAQWAQVQGFTQYAEGVPPGDWADIQLWAASEGPILLVSLSRVAGDPHEATVKDDLGDPPSPDTKVDERARKAGDDLFTEQGDTIHLPARTRPLIGTIPTFGGTGGSTSVLAASDSMKAVRAMLDEAQSTSEYGEVTGPTEVNDADGVQVVSGSFVIPAGGWGFSVVAVRGDGDPYATVYVTSGAD